MKNKAAVFCLYRCGLPWLSLPADGAPETSSARERHAPLFLRGSLRIELGEAEARPFRQRASESASSSPLCEEGVEVIMTIKNASSSEAKAHSATATA